MVHLDLATTASDTEIESPVAIRACVRIHAVQHIHIDGLDQRVPDRIATAGITHPANHAAAACGGVLGGRELRVHSQRPSDGNGHDEHGRTPDARQDARIQGGGDGVAEACGHRREAVVADSSQAAPAPPTQ
jgi:hypothetical protein